jgi:hypothetical protein
MRPLWNTWLRWCTPNCIGSRDVTWLVRERAAYCSLPPW